MSKNKPKSSRLVESDTKVHSLFIVENPDRDVLPNLFPFKQQMLQEFKSTLPQ